ncbi:chitinase [Nesterenkonia flava]|uniref:Glycosyl hydrolase family 18 protein n=1 Tax=Nesterenkonia flava TaxID=469799 RepID=A0ABU1FV60_9MICC|nr:carbohydrate-binding protein [Nesterenkonia flava]MDR5712557.1 glycosyl hydrolase family 18 protein [Nesterenkonia flava]
MSGSVAPRLSKIRTVLALVVLATIVVGTVLGVRMMSGAEADDVGGSWYAGYVDVTAVPRYAFEAGAPHPEGPSETGAEEAPAEVPSRADDVVLSFIVAEAEDTCAPSWGTHYSLDAAGYEMDLDRRIARLRESGGDIVISFGGAINTELAVACDSVDELIDAYGQVIDRYSITTIDLDIEGPALQDAESIQRRAEAVAELQHMSREQQKPLAVWLTLPVVPQGLSSEGAEVVAAMLEAGVDLAGVNVMTMNYGEARGDLPMLEASVDSLRSLHRQLGALYRQAGVALSDDQLWHKIGATPMIGQNDVPGEIFTLEDARGLNEFAQEQGLGRMSMWSLNRDITCGPNYPNTDRVSDACSGVQQDGVRFSELLATGFTGRAAGAAGTVTAEVSEETTPVVDDPETSPYPIWNEEAAYLEGTKVVWRGSVYQAKWWTRGDLPDDPVVNLWETPWDLIGPVLPGDRPMPRPTLPEGTYDEWSGEQTYERGERVVVEDIPYEAKWWTQGESPEAAAVDPDGSPWRPLTMDEVEKILEQ